MLKRVAPIMLLLVAIAQLALPQWQAWDTRLADPLIRWHASQQQPDPDIVIIDIDDYSLERMQAEVGRWPWPRAVYGYLLEVLQPLAPQAVVFDVLFLEKDRFIADSDQYFVEMLSQTPRLYLASSLLANSSAEARQPFSNLPASVFIQQGTGDPDQPLALPWLLAPESWRIGLVNLFDVSDDGVVRNYPLWFELQDWRIASLPYRLALDLWHIAPRTSLQIHLNFQATDPRGYARIPFYDLYQQLSQGGLNAATQARVQGKLLLIGATATGLSDMRHTPIAAFHPGPDILATAVDNLKHGRDYLWLGNAWRLTLGALMLLVLAGIWRQPLTYRQWWWRSSLWLISVVLLLTLSNLWLVRQLWLLPSAALLSTALLSYVSCHFYQGWLQYQKRLQATQMFGRFMDPTVVKQLLNGQSLAELTQSQARPLTILFTDIRNFTTLSESRSPEQVISFLNAYLDMQVATIFKYGGTLDKFIGDAIMAFWGAPLSDPQHASRALQAAQEMLNNLQQFRRSLPADLQTLDIGIGIHSGTAVVGVLGSNKRFDYTAIGDAVNLASRIEGLTKQHGRLLISKACYHAAGQPIAYDYIGDFQVKGRTEAVSLFRYLEPNHETVSDTSAGVSELPIVGSVERPNH